MFLVQRLSVAVQRGNAACILGTVADEDRIRELSFYLEVHSIVINNERDPRLDLHK
jgi:hypothetical protein